ncbi:crossover junction endodeoxyribonuclease RuvC [Pendulispora albinea]|uniref:Crossover junction endodeoxyribonuclease RuvC n=1 Tax=Pendulispora albinea TaxID=2741071 RepID=A0ABZ2M247_9BACT
MTKRDPAVPAATARSRTSAGTAMPRATAAASRLAAPRSPAAGADEIRERQPTAIVARHAQTVLGIDPGTRRMGWGIVSRKGSRLVHVAHGVIAAGDDVPLAERLVTIERELDRIVQNQAVGQASVESLFFHKDAQAAAKLGHARGVALLVCARAGLDIAEYAPARVKRTVTGRGAADKVQVAQMIRAILSLPEAPPSDAADALALAVTHLQNTPLATAAAAGLTLRR